MVPFAWWFYLRVQVRKRWEILPRRKKASPPVSDLRSPSIAWVRPLLVNSKLRAFRRAKMAFRDHRVAAAGVAGIACFRAQPESAGSLEAGSGPTREVSDRWDTVGWRAENEYETVGGL